MKCTRCGKEFLGEDWQKVCRKCWAETKKGIQTAKKSEHQIDDVNRQIILQTMFKVASRLLPQNTPASKVIEYAKQLETGFYQ